MEISCAFAPTSSTPAHIELAEELGYGRAWCYDSPAMYRDVWVTLALAAERTDRIGLGPAVLVPSLRHPMVTATAIADLVDLAPGRVAAALGTGWSGRVALGQRPLPWREVIEYVQVLKRLLAGDPARWEGATIQMLQGVGCAPERPIEVPLLLGANGPRGQALAEEVADGIFVALRPMLEETVLPWRSLLVLGTVLEEGETPSSARAKDALAPAIANLYHGAYARGLESFKRLPGADVWRASVEDAPEDKQHLAVHEGHLVESNRHDELVLDRAIETLAGYTVTGRAYEVIDRLGEFRDQGFTEIVYQPAGPDIRRELRAFAAAARKVPGVTTEIGSQV